MKLWIGGIIDAIIGDDFRLLRNKAEEKINAAISGVDYGAGMSTWDVILVVSSTPPKEYVRYNKANKETDVRIIVNFNTFLESNSNGRFKILEQALLQSITFLSKKKILDFDFKRLQQDVIAALNTS